jgi:hypothetical protein
MLTLHSFVRAGALASLILSQGCGGASSDTSADSGAGSVAGGGGDSGAGSGGASTGSVDAVALQRLSTSV